MSLPESKSVSFKVSLFNEEGCQVEVRRFGIEQDVVTSFPFLRMKLKALFPAINSSAFKVLWKDVEGDDIVVSSSDELMEALLQDANNDVYKLSVHLLPEKKEDEQHEPQSHSLSGATVSSLTIHPNIICDGCDQEIVGTRFKCLQCADYDLCRKCESTCKHRHLMLRVDRPIWPKKNRRFQKYCNMTGSLFQDFTSDEKACRTKRSASNLADQAANFTKLKKALEGILQPLDLDFLLYGDDGLDPTVVVSAGTSEQRYENCAAEAQEKEEEVVESDNIEAEVEDAGEPQPAEVVDRTSVMVEAATSIQTMPESENDVAPVSDNEEEAAAALPTADERSKATANAAPAQKAPQMDDPAGFCTHQANYEYNVQMKMKDRLAAQARRSMQGMQARQVPKISLSYPVMHQPQHQSVYPPLPTAAMPGVVSSPAEYGQRMYNGSPQNFTQRGIYNYPGFTYTQSSTMPVSSPATNTYNRGTYGAAPLFQANSTGTNNHDYTNQPWVQWYNSTGFRPQQQQQQQQVPPVQRVYGQGMPATIPENLPEPLIPTPVRPQPQSAQHTQRIQTTQRTQRSQSAQHFLAAEMIQPAQPPQRAMSAQSGGQTTQSGQTAAPTRRQISSEDRTEAMLWSAVERMVEMGFSNNDGHIYHVLQLVDGNIDRAIERLINPNII